MWGLSLGYFSCKAGSHISLFCLGIFQHSCCVFSDTANDSTLIVKSLKVILTPLQVVVSTSNLSPANESWILPPPAAGGGTQPNHLGGGHDWINHLPLISQPLNFQTYRLDLDIRDAIFRWSLSCADTHRQNKETSKSDVMVRTTVEFQKLQLLRKLFNISKKSLSSALCLLQLVA